MMSLSLSLSPKWGLAARLAFDLGHKKRQTGAALKEQITSYGGA
jgi:hypothetical protein